MEKFYSSNDNISLCYKSVDEPDDIVLTITNGNSKMEITVPKYSDIWDWGDTIRTMLTWLTFQPQTIDKLFNQCDCEDCEDCE